ncbi:MAG: nuclear transport factor 2 family protein [Hyphomicrobium sp.]|jgi:hypothetical protein
MKAPLDVIRAFYSAIADGNAQRVLSLLDDDLHWTEAEGFPYYSGTWRSPSDVLEKLLVPLSQDWLNFAASPDEFITADNRVITLGVYSGVAKSTGKTMRAPFAHAWRVRGDKISHFDMYTDTLLVARALGPD